MALVIAIAVPIRRTILMLHNLEQQLGGVPVPKASCTKRQFCRGLSAFAHERTLPSHQTHCLTAHFRSASSDIHCAATRQRYAVRGSGL